MLSVQCSWNLWRETIEMLDTISTISSPLCSLATFLLSTWSEWLLPVSLCSHLQPLGTLIKTAVRLNLLWKLLNYSPPQGQELTTKHIIRFGPKIRYCCEWSDTLSCLYFKQMNQKWPLMRLMWTSARCLINYITCLVINNSSRHSARIINYLRTSSG